MNNTLQLIYTLIMLECRLSLEDASKLFKIDAEELRKEMMRKSTLSYKLKKALEYLIYESYTYPKPNTKGIWKAQNFLRRLYKILAIEDKDEKKELLRKFIIMLYGPDITFTINRNTPYTEKEKIILLKYRVKYGCYNAEMKKIAAHATLSNWEEALEDGELKNSFSNFKRL